MQPTKCLYNGRVAIGHDVILVHIERDFQAIAEVTPIAKVDA